MRELLTGKDKKTLLMVLMAAVFLFSAGMMIRSQIQYQKIAQDRAEAAAVAGLTKRPQLSSAGPESVQPETQAEPLPDEAASLAEIDLDALRAVNEDVVGWIAIPGTELSYPLMQGTDNQYYLTHNWKKEYAGGGSVFLEATNSGDLTGFHTIAYAHRMRNGTMFGATKYYKDLDFWREHPSVYVVLSGGIYRYNIFSAHESRVKGVVYRLDIEESHLEEEFLQYCFENSVIDTGLTPGTDGRFLTLSTCTGNGYATRWTVHGFLAQEYELDLPE